MKSFDEWQRERRKESNKFGRLNFFIYIWGVALALIGTILEFPVQIVAWILPIMLMLQLLHMVAHSMLQWRSNATESRAEKVETEQRWAREDMELNATVLLPPER